MRPYDPSTFNPDGHIFEGRRPVGYRLEDECRGPWEEAAYCFGAAVAFGLMGMAEAIRAREDERQSRKDFEDRMLEADMG